jgi:hypothetical protein
MSNQPDDLGRLHADLESAREDREEYLKAADRARAEREAEAERDAAWDAVRRPLRSAGKREGEDLSTAEGHARAWTVRLAGLVDLLKRQGLYGFVEAWQPPPDDVAGKATKAIFRLLERGPDDPELQALILKAKSADLFHDIRVHRLQDIRMWIENRHVAERRAAVEGQPRDAAPDGGAGGGPTDVPQPGTEVEMGAADLIPPRVLARQDEGRQRRQLTEQARRRSTRLAEAWAKVCDHPATQPLAPTEPGRGAESPGGEAGREPGEPAVLSWADDFLALGRLIREESLAECFDEPDHATDKSEAAEARRFVAGVLRYAMDEDRGAVARNLRGVLKHGGSFYGAVRGELHEALTHTVWYLRRRLASSIGVHPDDLHPLLPAASAPASAAGATPGKTDAPETFGGSLTRRGMEQEIRRGRRILWHGPGREHAAITRIEDLPGDEEIALLRTDPLDDLTPAGYVAWCEAHRQKLVRLLGLDPDMERRCWNTSQGYVRVAGQLGMRLNPEGAVAAGSLFEDCLRWQDKSPFRAMEQLTRCAEWGRGPLPRAAAADPEPAPPEVVAGLHGGRLPGATGVEPERAGADDNGAGADADHAPEDPALSDLEYDILEALYRLKATDPEKRRTAEDLAGRIGGGATAASCKVPVARLGRRGLVRTKEGRSGGCWLSPAGVALIKRARKL